MKRCHPFRFLALLFAFWGLSSCKDSNETKFPEKSAWFGLAIPQWLTGDTTILYVADYFYQDAQFDSVSASAGIKVEYSKGADQLKVIKTSADIHLFALNFYKGGFPYQLILKNRPKFEHEFKFQGSANVQSVGIKGDFNGWNASATPMQKSDNQTFTSKVKVAPGEYGYQLVVDGNAILDPANPLTRSNGMGGTNSVLKAQLKEPDLRLITEDFDEDSIRIRIMGDAQDIRVLWENYPLANPGKVSNAMVSLPIPKAAKKVKRSFIRVFAANAYGHANDVLIPLEMGAPVTGGKSLDRADIENTVMYFAFIDRFADGDASNNHPVQDKNVLPKANYYGGDLQGILDQLKKGYFTELGVNALWISPIAQNPLDAWGQFKDPDTRFSGYHGYWPVSSSAIDFRLGNEKVMIELLKEAHARGINVYLDYVANHVHKQHPVYQKHPDWATSLYLPDGTLNTERWDDHRLTTWFDTFMPTLDLENAHVAEYMSDSALFWMKRYDFDGFRHDATKHIPESFWRIVTRKMKQESAAKGIQRFYQIGETYGNPELISGYLGNGLLDAQFDFNLYDQMLPAFAYGETTFGSLVGEQKRSLSYYGHHHLMGNVTGNQDKPRFISYADGQLPRNLGVNEYKRLGWKDAIKGVKHDTAYRRMELMQTYLLTVPGIPVIYYGDEIGMPGAGDPDNRRMMKFNELSAQESHMKNHVKKLSALRRSHPSLVYGDFNFEHVYEQVMVYSRRYFDEFALVGINKSNQSERVTITLPDGFNRVIESVFSEGATVTFQKNQVEVLIPAGGSCVYVITKNKK